MKASQEHILIIKHGALGDMVLATAPFAAIRAHHPEAHITFLTTAPYAGLMQNAPYFDEIIVDTRPKWWQLGDWLNLWQNLRKHPYACVYDLQTSSRSTGYYRLMPSPKAEWSGLVKGCAFEHNTLHRKTSHTIDRQQEQLAIAGVDYAPKVDVSWLKSDVSQFELPKKYALLIAGGSAHRPEKRWPVERFAELAGWLLEQGVLPVLIGTNAESAELEAIKAKAKGCLNLCNQTSFADLAQLGRGAALVVGNDTGPMHLAAAAGAPSIVLFSAASNPDLCAPRGEHITVLREENLADLPLDTVTEAINTPLAQPALASSAAIA